MRLAVIHLSIHHHNTASIAEAIAHSIHARLLTVSEAREFCSPGWDTVGPLKYLGGIHRGRPNAADRQQAAAFGQEVLAKN